MHIVSSFNDNPFEKFLERLGKEIKRSEKDTPIPEYEPKRFRSKRAELFNELYSLYEISYKRNTWKIYRSWLARNRFKHSQAKLNEFKKTKLFRKPISVKSFCSYWFGFLKTNDLYYLLSIARDKINRKENLNSWLFWAIKKQ